MKEKPICGQPATVSHAVPSTMEGCNARDSNAEYGALRWLTKQPCRGGVLMPQWTAVYKNDHEIMYNGRKSQGTLYTGTYGKMRRDLARHIAGKLA